MFGKDCSKYEDKIVELTLELEEKNQKIEELEGYIQQLDLEKTGLRNTVETLKDVMKELDEFKIRTIVISDEYFASIKFSKNATAFHSKTDLGLSYDDYVILQNESEKASCLVRLESRELVRVRNLFYRSEEFGYNDGYLFKRDIKLSYPSMTEEDTIHVYKIVLIS